MSELSPRDRALVGIGAALGSNCIPCIEHHIPAARSAGLSDDEIRAALGLADTIRQVPARRVLARATERVSIPAAESGPAASCGTVEKKSVEQTLDAMASTMQKKMSNCGPAAPAVSTGGDSAAASKPTSGCC